MDINAILEEVKRSDDTEKLKEVVTMLRNQKGIAFKLREAAKARLIELKAKQSTLPEGFTFGINPWAAGIIGFAVCLIVIYLVDLIAYV